MHKKLATDLTSLAHSILQMKNKEDVFALKVKAYEVYEKLALLAYVEEYINNTPNATTNKGILLAKIAAVENDATEDTSTVEKNIEDPIATVKETNNLLEKEEGIKTGTVIIDDFFVENKDREEIPFSLTEEKEPTPTKPVIDNDPIEQPFDELENILFGEEPIEEEIAAVEEIKTTFLLEEEQEDTDNVETNFIEVIKPEPIEEEFIDEEPISIKEDKTPTLEEELADTISVDVMANLFEKAPPKTLNDKLFQDTVKIDLNDRIAFVNNLFEGNQEDFNRVISQLNTCKTEKEAKHFIAKMVKPDYDWSNHESYENRLLEIIEKRFS